jgi:type I restriction enzyme S subunit/type I restriction enzyme M protein
MPLTFGDEKMTVYSIVKLSELKGAKRIDADRYRVEFLELDNNLRKISFIRELKSLIVEPVRTGHTPRDRDIYEGDKRIYFIKTDTLREGLIDFENSDFLPDRSLSERDYLKPKDVIVTIIGAHFDVIGRAAIFLPHHPQTVVNQNIAVIKPDENILNPFYLMVFLNSKYGREQLWMLSRQTEQVNLNCREVEKLLVPVFDIDFQKEIELFSKKSSELVEKSKSLYSHAETLLLEELGLKGFKPRYEKTYTANLSSILSAHRIDAEYFQPTYDEVVKKIKNYKNGFSKLLKHVENVKPDFDPTKYPDKTFSYVELADIDTSIGVIHSTSEIKGEQAPSRARRILRKNDVIVSSVEGSLEKVALVSKEYEGSLASTGFFQLRPRKILPEVLLVLSKSTVLQIQLKKACAGTILTAVPNESLKRILIPILPNEFQQKIASLVRQSHEARRKAKELLDEAKRKVEKAIEKEL